MNVSYIVNIFLLICLIIFIVLFFKKDFIKKPFFISKSTNRIHLWHAERENKFTFMYSPAVLSLKEIITVIYPHIEINFKINYFEWDDIKPNDMLIWVGWESKPDFKYFQNKNIYTVYYNTEPFFDYESSDEIWTYSKYMFNLYEKKNGSKIVRFIPILCEKNLPCVPYLLKESKMNLVFIGNLSFRIEKKNILMENHLIKENLEEIYHIWDNNEFTTFISSRPYIFINLLKTDTIALPSFRINKLLSHRCIIISEYTNSTDELYYKDLIIFCELKNIELEYKKLLELSNLELHKLSNQIYKKFYSRFSIKNAMKIVSQKIV